MLNIYRTDERVLNKLTDFRDGVWVQMVDPTSNELSRVAEQYEIELDDLATAMDDEESSRISLEDGYTLILVDIPSPEVRHEKKMYTTIPLGIILKQNSKTPSMMSICSQSASLALILSKSAFKLPKSADNKEGEISISFFILHLI